MGDNDAWATWIADQLTRKSWRQADAARAFGVADSMVSKWVRAVAGPDKRSLRRVADALEVPILSVLIAAEYLFADEAGQIPSAPPDLESLTADELLSEVRRRMRDPEAKGKASPRSHESPTVAYPTHAVMPDPPGEYRRWADDGGEQAR